MTVRALVRRARLTSAERRREDWVAAGHDRTLRLDYDLGPSSVVFDLGGYEGQWAADIRARYGCTVHVFEPVVSFARRIERRFAHDASVHVHPFGLAGSTRVDTIHLDADGSSLFGTGEPVEIQLVHAAGHLRHDVDLVKVNIEGGEFELLEHLVATGLVERVRELQVQFHEHVPHAEARMRRLQAALARTHRKTWGVDFVWENWRRR